jgi:hypothetical protein
MFSVCDFYAFGFYKLASTNNQPKGQKQPKIHLVDIRETKVLDGSFFFVSY